jgi:choline kinase
VQAVLLAAGLGSRLGGLTANLPKALISVGGEPLLVRAVRFAEATRARGIIVVGGYEFDRVAALVAERDLPVVLLENPAFRDGNLVSLLSASSRVSDDFLVMNIDHIYRPAIAELVAADVEEVTAFIDTDRPLAADDMKVARDGRGRVSRISKTLTEFDAGYVGMTRVPAHAAARYWETADAVLAEQGRAVHVEQVLARLAQSVRPPICRDISGHGWLEVDVPEERDRADQTLRQGGW